MILAIELLKTKRERPTDLSGFVGKIAFDLLHARSRLCHLFPLFFLAFSRPPFAERRAPSV